ncbi:MAG: COP9 signalosome complex subunit 4 [Phylliscum demangeonii]|nr:MAG: COP9 signalosome complex subunit 4 [Phylliscum demangeonii]
MEREAILRELSVLRTSTSSPKESADARTLVRTTFAAESDEAVMRELRAWLQLILVESAGIMTSRPLLRGFILALQHLPQTAVQIAVGQRALELIAPRLASFEQEEAEIRHTMAGAYEQAADYTAAARVLQGIQLESSQRTVSNDDKIAVWVRIVRDYIEADQFADAEVYLSRIKNLTDRPTTAELAARLLLCQARIYDYRRRFLDAFQAFYDFSLMEVVADDDRLMSLRAAIVCAILAPAGPQRSRVLAHAYRDERVRALPEFALVQKMVLDRLVAGDEIAAFAASLSAHHLATNADGLTVLQKAMIEHNVVAISKLFLDIDLQGLGDRLDVSAAMAEEYVAQMISDGRLTAHIDEIQAILYFDDDAAADPVEQWHGNVQAVMTDLERTVGMIRDSDPDFAAHFQTQLNQLGTEVHP